MKTHQIYDGICQFVRVARSRRMVVGEWEIEFPTPDSRCRDEWWEWWAKQMNIVDRCLKWVTFSNELNDAVAGAKQRPASMNEAVLSEYVVDTIFLLPSDDSAEAATIPSSGVIQLGREDDDRAFLDARIFCNIFTPEIRVGTRLFNDSAATVCFSEFCHANRLRIAESFDQLRNRGFSVTGISSDEIEGLNNSGFSESAKLKWSE